MTLIKSSFVLSTTLLAASSALADLVRRIEGGDQAEPGEYPYYVKGPGCGGALVAPDIVLFAAHCSRWENHQVGISTYYEDQLGRIWNTGGVQARFCDQVIYDPLFNVSTLNYDFALCKLDKPVELVGKVTLELNEDDSVPTKDDDLQIMGHGRASPTYTPFLLKKDTVPYVSRRSCTRNSSGGPIKVTGMMLCYGGNGQGSCLGDSGSPVVKRTIKDNGSIVDTHVGVTSWSRGCGKDRPSGAARTSKRIDWIKNTACNELKSVAPFCDNPADPPTCDEGAVLSITITTDTNPQETSWTLIDNTTGREVMKRQFRVRELEYEHELCLEKDTDYSWEITNDAPYVITLNGEEIASNVDAEYSKKVNFNAGDFLIESEESSSESEGSSSECVINRKWRSPNGKRCGAHISKAKTLLKKREKCNNDAGNGTKVVDQCKKACGKHAGVGPCKYLFDSDKVADN